MKNVALFVLLLLAANSAIAVESQKYYLKAEFGMGKGKARTDVLLINNTAPNEIIKKDYKNNLFGFAAGNKVDNMSLELEYFHSSYKLSTEDDTLESKAHNLLANIYYHTRTIAALSPYIMGGVGGSHGEQTLKHPDATAKVIKSKLVYQAGFGAEYLFDNDVALGLGYRFMGKAPSKSQATAPLGDFYTIKQKAEHLCLFDAKFYF